MDGRGGGLLKGIADGPMAAIVVPVYDSESRFAGVASYQKPLRGIPLGSISHIVIGLVEFRIARVAYHVVPFNDIHVTITTEDYMAGDEEKFVSGLIADGWQFQSAG